MCSNLHKGNTLRRNDQSDVNVFGTLSTKNCSKCVSVPKEPSVGVEILDADDLELVTIRVAGDSPFTRSGGN